MIEDGSTGGYRVHSRYGARGVRKQRGERIDLSCASALATSRVFPGRIDDDEPVYEMTAMVAYVVKRSRELGDPMSEADAGRILALDADFLDRLGRSVPPDDPAEPEREEEPF